MEAAEGKQEGAPWVTAAKRPGGGTRTASVAQGLEGATARGSEAEQAREGKTSAMPTRLLPGVPTTRDGKRMRFASNMGKCTEQVAAGERCKHGWHLCTCVGSHKTPCSHAECERVRGHMASGSDCFSRSSFFCLIFLDFSPPPSSPRHLRCGSIPQTSARRSQGWTTKARELQMKEDELHACPPQACW